MRPSPLFLATITLLAGGLIAGLAISAVGTPADDVTTAPDRVVTPLDAPTVGFGNPQRGASSPALDMVVFGDYQCGPCRDLEPAIAAVLRAHRDVRVVWKDFPNSSLHPQAVLAAVAARCADQQGAFWEYHDAVMGDAADTSEANLLRRADLLRLDLPAFQACLSTESTRPSVERDFEEGQRLRIDATPTIFIGTRRVSGALTAEQLLAAVEAELQKMRTTTPGSPRP
jgi:protein-disulfide isomerase